MRELLPCPFCGGEAEMRQLISFDETDGRDGLYSVGCYTDKCIGEYANNFYFYEAEAVEAWNTRAERTCYNTQHDFDFMCSNCGKMLDNGRVIGVNYCPNCGAKVVEE